MKENSNKKEEQASVIKTWFLHGPQAKELIRQTINSPLYKLEMTKLLSTKWKQVQTVYAHGSVMYQVMCTAHAHVSVTQHGDCSHPTRDCAAHYA